LGGKDTPGNPRPLPAGQGAAAQGAGGPDQTLQHPAYGAGENRLAQDASGAGAGGTHDFRGDYPVASCPCDERNLRFHIRRDESDEFAQRLFAGAIRPGDDVGVRGPWGDFVIERDGERPLLFVAAAEGYAPVASLIEHAMAAQSCESITLAWSAAPGGHYLANQCRAWAAALDDFRYLQIEAGEGAAAASTVLAAISESGIDVRASDVFVAGSAAFVEAIVRALDGAAPKTFVL